MKNISEIKKTLVRMSELLNSGNQPGWSKILINILSEINIEPNDTRNKIRNLYGGMGSLNDVVLYNKNQVLIEENDEFNFLRERLFDLI